MDELIERLRVRIKAMLAHVEETERTNHVLQKNKFWLTREKDALLESQKKAVSEIETLLAHLHELEETP